MRHGTGLAIEDHLLRTRLEMVVVMIERLVVMVLAQAHRAVLQVAQIGRLLCYNCVVMWLGRPLVVQEGSGGAGTALAFAGGPDGVVQGVTVAGPVLRRCRED